MEQQPEQLNLRRTLKIGSFHIGSAFSDILTSAVWNRVLITDLGIAATPVALLSALRYLLSPLSVWAGNRSDTHPLFGKRRLPYIWGGRALMIVGLFLLPVATIRIAADSGSWAGWLYALLSFLIYGIGTLISGSPYLALIRDSAPPSKRGQALSIAQIMLLVAFAFSPALYGLLMKHYDPALFWRIILIGSGLAVPFWLFSIMGEERPPADTPAVAPAEALPFRTLMRTMWADRDARNFFLFLSLASICAFAQDAILEPFGGDLFGMDIGQTTSFNAYWGLGVLLGMIVTTILTRKRAPHEQTGLTMVGLLLSALPLAMLGAVAMTRAQGLLAPVLVLFGVGFGVYTVGAISLLMAMTSDHQAGAYLGLWTVAQLVARGVGIGVGGLLRDLALWATGSFAMAYASVFVLEAIGLVFCVALLARVDIAGFAHGERTPAVSPLAALADG